MSVAMMTLAAAPVVAVVVSGIVMTLVVADFAVVAGEAGTG